MKKWKWIAVSGLFFLALIAVGVCADLSKSEWASWVQAIGSIAAVVAAVLVVQHSHNLVIDRANKELQRNRRASIEHWSSALLRGKEICEGAIKASEGMSGGADYFRAAKANLEMVLELMRKRDLNVLDSYDEIRHVSSGMAALAGAISHIDEVLQTQANLSSWHTNFQAAMVNIPQELNTCADLLERSLISD